MNAHRSEIAVILDRSGSMQPIAADAIGGYNGFLDAQKALPGEARLSLVLFDNEYLLVADAVPLPDAPHLTADTYVPRATTALLDAIGRTIDTLGARLAATPEPDRPGTVIVAILTDGQENASSSYTRDQVFAMIQHQQDVYGWQFVFLAANQDAIEAGAHLGIAAADTHAFTADAAGTLRGFDAMACMVSERRLPSRGKRPRRPDA